MKRFMLLMCFIMLVSSSVALLAQNSNKSRQQQKTDDNTGKSLERSYPGYLSDVSSALKGKDKQGNDLRINPGKHNIKDMRAGVDSGYGVFLRLKNGEFKFFRLDTPGSFMAKEIIATTIKTSNIYVIVKGTIRADGSIKTNWIQEVKPGKDKLNVSKKSDNSKVSR